MYRDNEELKNCRYMTYPEGGRYYSIGWVRFRKIAREANAIFRVGKRYLVDKAVLDAYFAKMKEGGSDL